MIRKKVNLLRCKGHRDLGSGLNSATLLLCNFGQVNSPHQVLVVPSYIKDFTSTVVLYISPCIPPNFYCKSSLNAICFIGIHDYIFIEETTLDQNKSVHFFATTYCLLLNSTFISS